MIPCKMENKSRVTKNLTHRFMDGVFIPSTLEDGTRIVEDLSRRQRRRGLSGRRGGGGGGPGGGSDHRVHHLMSLAGEGGGAS